jgi:hypothetical protein
MTDEAARDRETLESIHQTIYVGGEITDERVNILKAVANAAAASLAKPFDQGQSDKALRELHELATRLKKSAPT